MTPFMDGPLSHSQSEESLSEEQVRGKQLAQGHYTTVARVRLEPSTLGLRGKNPTTTVKLLAPI